MTRPIAEDSESKAIGRNAYGVDQLQRRPGESMLVANLNLVWPFADGDSAAGNNPWLARDGAGTLVYAMISAVAGALGCEAWLYDVNDTGDIDTAVNLLAVVPGPLELGATPFAPTAFTLGIAVQMLYVDASEVDPADLISLTLGIAI